MLNSSKATQKTVGETEECYDYTAWRRGGTEIKESFAREVLSQALRVVGNIRKIHMRLSIRILNTG